MIEPSRMSCVVIQDRAYHALQDAVHRTGRYFKDPEGNIVGVMQPDPQAK
jgi:hypothetical protein